MTTEKQPSQMLGYAKHYALTRGWSIIPTKPDTKKAAGSWKQHQVVRARESKLEKWFGNGENHGVAVVLGQVSGGLVCRDYDVQEAYDRWAAANPELAATLPTVATARGRHVYFRAPAADLIFVALPDGEYRGDSGHYCLLPPSRHPDGPAYEWLILPGDGEIPFVADVRAAGLLPTEANVTEDTDETEDTEDTEDTEETEAMSKSVCDAPSLAPLPPTYCPVSSVSSVTSEEADAEIERAILATIPARTGRRNLQVFELARALKGIPRLAEAPADAMKSHVRRWHRIALERAVIGTEPFEETLIDFLHAWPRVKFPKGNQRVLAIVQRAKDSPPPAVAQNYEGDGLRLLVSVCREFQRESGSNPFFLSCRMAATLLGLGENGHVSAWRWLELLVHDKVLENVEPGERGKRRATRYRYIGDRQT